MGTDRSEIHRGPCYCGKGEFVINSCTPDHPWPTKSKWYEKKIECEICKKQYSLVEQDGNIILVRISDITERENMGKDYHCKSNDLMTSGRVKEILIDLEVLLSSQKSVANIYRVLSSADLTRGVEGTFRKHWIDASKWIERNIYYWNLLSVMKLLGIEDAQVAEKIAQIESLRKASSKPYPSVGDPLCKVS